MANQTVYPYGTGGKLPSSIGLINDVVTGGADKALAAQQGVYLMGEINGVKQELTGVDGRGVVWSDGYVNTSGLIKTSSASKFSQPFLLKAGEWVTIGTRNTNITIIGSTSASSLAVGDTVTVIQTTSSADQYETYRYYATVDTYIVLCVRSSEYDLSIFDTKSFFSKLLSVKVSLSSIERHDGLIAQDNVWYYSSGSSSKYVLLPITPGSSYKVSATEAEAQVAVLADSEPGVPQNEPVWATGFEKRIVLTAGSVFVFTAPQDAEVLYVRLLSNAGDNMAPDIYTSIIDGADALDESRLLEATFNSSFNETDTESVREAVAAKIGDKDSVETFLFFSDPHLTPESRYETMTDFIRDKYISALQKYYNSLPLDYCICGGDWLNFNHSNIEAKAWLGYCDAYMRKLFRNYYPIFGNHDNNPYNPTSDSGNWLNALTYKEIQNVMFRENRGTYYSFDGVNTKFYVLNSGVSFIKSMTDNTYSRLVSNRWPQIAWLGQKLLADDAPHSVIALHIFSNASKESDWFATGTAYWANGIHALAENAKKLCVAYNNRQSITLNGNTYNFSSCAGKVAFFLCGHTHFDYIDTSGDIPIVCTTNLEGGHFVNDSIKYDLVPTFDNCVVNYDDSVLSMVRVGAGVSRTIHFATVPVSVGSTTTLTSGLSGTLTWQSRNTAKATVSDGTVSGVASGYSGIIATDANGEQEYWIIKVS